MKQDGFQEGTCSIFKLASGPGNQTFILRILFKTEIPLQNGKNSSCRKKYAVQTQGCNKKKKKTLQAHFMESSRAIN